MSTTEPNRALLIPLSADDSSGGIRLKDLVDIVLRLRVSLIALLVVCVGLVMSLYALTETKYKATAIAMVTDQGDGLSMNRLLGSQLGGLAGMAGFALPESGGLRAEAFATLESRELLRNVITTNNLLPILFYKEWNEEREAWVTDDGLAPSIEKAVTFFEEDVLSLTREPGSEIVEISIVWRDPELAAQWINKLVQHVNSSMRERAIVEATKSVEYLEAELEKSSNTELNAAIYALMEEQMAKIMLANVRSDFAFSIIDSAMPPDADDKHSPRLIFYLAAAICLWGLLSLAVVAVVAFRSRQD